MADPLSESPLARQSGETARAHAALVAYLELGPERSLRKLAECGSVAVKLRQLEAWSARWSWTDRAEAYDRTLTLARGNGTLQATRDQGAVAAAAVRDEVHRKLIAVARRLHTKIAAELERDDWTPRDVPAGSGR